MSVEMTLYITLIIYSIMNVIGYMFDMKFLYFLSGILWFVPITLIDNLWVVLASVIMLIMQFIIGMTDNSESEF